MSPLVVVTAGVLLILGCKDQRDKTCERAVDIALKCDAAKIVGNDRTDGVRDYMLEICKEAFTDDPAGATNGTEAKIRQEVREYAECKAKAESCEDYQRCEALLHLPAK